MNLRILIILLTFHASLVLGQTSLHEIALENGKYEAGFRHYLTSDSTRTYKRMFDSNNKSIPRPIHVSIWYPSHESDKDIEAMKVIDYMEILKEEEEWGYLPNDQILNWFYQSTPESQKHLGEHTTALHKSEVASGKFPIIIYAPSHQASSIENFALCEYLASHGFIVIASTSRGSETRWLEGAAEKEMETQARDIEFLIKEIEKFPNIESGLIATMGFSFGGLSNVLSQMRNDNIKAIVSLDGSIKYQYNTLKKSAFFDLKKVDVPFIHMAQKDIPNEVLFEDKIDAELNSRFEFYDSISYSRAYQLKFNNLTHSYFSTLGVLFEQRDQRQDKGDREIMESYKWVSEYTLNFLNAFMKEDSSALRFIDNNPSENGVGDGLITYHSKMPDRKGFSFQDFNELASKQDYENLNELYNTILKDDPSVELSEGNLNNLGLQLLFNPATSMQGINVLLLATSIYGNSANLFDSLAEAYLFVGDKQKAIENFEKSLHLNSQNQNAIDRLELLRK